MSENILEVKNLKTKFYTEAGIVSAVDDLSFSLEKGKILAVVGESGCGKSVTGMSILNMVKPPGKITEGEVLFCGNNLLLKSQKELRSIRGNEISMIFQEPAAALNPVMKIGAQLAEAITNHKNIDGSRALYEGEGLLAKMGIHSPADIMKSYPHELSGGMCQRVMIAMAIACEPKLLIADEPTTNLDVTIQAQILNLLEELKNTMGLSIMLITHDMGIVAQIADEVLVMYAGQAVEHTEAEVIFDNPRHPYTAGLLKSIPSLTENQEELYNIAGMVPDAAEFTEGCRFAPRCEYALEICFSENPQIHKISPKHMLRCHRYGENAYE